MHTTERKLFARDPRWRSPWKRFRQREMDIIQQSRMGSACWWSDDFGRQLWLVWSRSTSRTVRVLLEGKHFKRVAVVKLSLGVCRDRHARELWTWFSQLWSRLELNVVWMCAQSSQSRSVSAFRLGCFGCYLNQCITNLRIVSATSWKGSSRT